MTSIRNNIDNSMTEQQVDHQQQEDYNYYNNPHARARARARGEAPLPSAEVMAMIADNYRANISDKITRAASQIIEDALRHGMEPDTVIMAIEETGLASRPSPYYLRAVLRNWADSGVTVSRVRGTQGITDALPWWK